MLQHLVSVNDVKGSGGNAPAARTPTTVDAGDDASNRDLWNAIDEGHDPTR